MKRVRVYDKELEKTNKQRKKKMKLKIEFKT